MIERTPSAADRWARPALVAVAALAALLYARNLASSDFAPYYSAALRSMSESWSAFAFGSFDPAGSISLDKIPGFLWPQALAVRALGFHAWAAVLPQVLEGVVAVVFLYRAVRRWAGAGAGVLAAAIFTFTPVAASMFGHAMEDGALTACSVLAASAWQRAVDTARLRALLVAGAWVGLGFQAKMLMAWAVLPAFAVAYLVAAPAPLVRRLGHLALAGAVVAAVSGSWMLLVALTPAAARPFVDGTTSNDVVGMVLGYNGATRFGVPGVAGAITPDFGQLPAAASGAFKLLDPHLATQIGWLYPLAVVSFAAGMWERRGHHRTDHVRAGLLMWGLWLAGTAAAYSAGTVLHTTYMAALAAPLAALSGYGIVRLAQAARAGGAGARLLPATAAVTVAWAAFLSSRYPAFLPWVTPAAIALGGLGALALLARPGGGRLATVGVVCAAAAMVATPTAWAASALDPLSDGTVLDASAGPSGIFDLVAPTVDEASRERLEGVPYAGAGIGLGPLTPQQRATLDYLEAHRGGARYLVATQSVALATLYIRDTGQPVLLVGGFTGRAPFPTPARFRELVADGQVRYALEPAAPQGSATTRDAIAAWVRATCRPLSPGTQPVAPMGDQLYAC